MDDRIEEKKLQVNQLQLLQGEYAGEIRLLQEQMNSSQASEQQFTSRIGELREKSEALAKEKEQLVSQTGSTPLCGYEYFEAPGKIPGIYYAAAQW